MCGIAGVFFRDRSREVELDLIRDMTEVLSHRGPDDGGVALLGPVALGHRRLSILDLSAAGHQPMSSPDRRFWISFNGEIYNFLSLREELESNGVRFRTDSDTEVLLELYRALGPSCLERLNGMFACAIYDRLEHCLFLARDRLGKKPLYLWESEGRLCFASELKSFTTVPDFDEEIDSSALADFLGTLYIPDPKTIYRDVRRLEPAHALLVDGQGSRQFRYWHPCVNFAPPFCSGAHPNAADTRSGGQSDTTVGSSSARATSTSYSERAQSLEQATERFESLLEDAVRLRMISDVPLGAFLSGGIDSSLVVSEMSRRSSVPVRTTAIGFDVAEEDESPYAKEVARLLGCDHHTEIVQADAAELLETLLWHFDEPFADGSALPTYLLSQITRSRVTVALSGDGGDEGFGGYDKYIAEMRERKIRRTLPPGSWRLLSRAAGLAETLVGARAPMAWGGISDRLASIALAEPGHADLDMGSGILSARALSSSGSSRVKKTGRQLLRQGLSRWGVTVHPFHRAGNLLRVLEEEPARAYFQTQCFTDSSVAQALLTEEVREGLRPYDPAARSVAAYASLDGADPLSRLQMVDLATYLPGDILTKVDRMSMAHALEVRCPLLDHRVIELALSLAPALKIHGGEGKRVLKRSLERRVPRRLIDRPKHGFTIPVDPWFRGPLIGLFHDVVLNGPLRRSGLINMSAAELLLNRHRVELGNHGMTLWTLLVLGVWYEKVLGKRAVPKRRGARLHVEVVGRVVN